MEFTKNGNTYTLVRTDDVTSDGAVVFAYSVWNCKGQQVNAGEVCATTAREAREIILGF